MGESGNAPKAEVLTMGWLRNLIVIIGIVASAIMYVQSTNQRVALIEADQARVEKLVERYNTETNAHCEVLVAGVRSDMDKRLAAIEDKIDKAAQANVEVLLRLAAMDGKLSNIERALNIKNSREEE
jgi:hypothetical protein